MENLFGPLDITNELLCCLCFGGVSIAGAVGFVIWYIKRQNKSETSGDEKKSIASNVARLVSS